MRWMPSEWSSSGDRAWAWGTEEIAEFGFPDAASPGEVLVSAAVRMLLARSGIAFEDRAEHELKGVSEAWRLFAVAG
jgi:hypothetical protein